MSSSWYYPDADSYTIGEKRPLHLLNPNQFYKVCPGMTFEEEDTDDGNAYGYSNGSQSRTIGDHDPICGDGSPFCFFVSKPSQKYANKNKVLLELMGGGACWDEETCDKQADMLFVSENLDENLGRSCQEVQYGMQQDGSETNMLCSYQFRDDKGSVAVDFKEYNTIIIPYCTQDDHLGSNTMVYGNDGDDDNNGRTVHHKGANNLLSVVQWVAKNFPTLRHAAVTGCSAGGTAVPVLQQLLHKHYNHFGNRVTQINALADSPVYLTPSWFLENALDNWNPQPILASIGVPYDKYRNSEEYPTKMWDYILRKGNNNNRWGLVSHTDDPVSLAYYQYMSGGNDNDDDGGYSDDAYNNDDNNNYNRRLDEGDLSDQWYSEMTSSVKYIQKRHRNVKSYWIESEGHCSFGLYYALQEEGFPSFAASIFKEDVLYLSPQPAVRAFFLAAGTGTLLLAWLVFNRIRRQSSMDGSGMMEDEDGNPTAPEADGLWSDASPNTAGADDSDTVNTRKSAFAVRRKLRNILVKMEDCPVTSGYALWITVYFVAMMVREGFAHPINNPSLGPSAVGLSVFGINNPSLIVYRHQWFRLFTSNFLVSGVLTLGMAYFYLWHRIRKLEERMIHDFKSPWLFVTIIIVLATTINATYCLVPQRRGASTAALPLLMGLQAFHLTFYWNSFVRIYLSIAAVVVDFCVVVSIFPFNSWIMTVAALVAGWVTAKMARTFDVWLPGPMMNVLKQSGIHLELGSTTGSVVSPNGGPASFGTALSFPPTQAASESEYNNFDGNLSNSYETMDDHRSTSPDHNKNRRNKFVRRAVCCGLSALLVLVLVPLFITLVAKPHEIYLEAFRTGCKSFYTVDIDDLTAASFFSDDDDGNENYDEARRNLVASTAEATTASFVRWLAGGDEEGGYECAEFCVPHLLVPFVKGALRKKQVPVERGQCSDNGYSTHVLDKTFSALSYSLDVELYAASNDDDDAEK